MKKPKIKYLSQCRNCRSSELQKFLHLPDMPFTDDFITKDRQGQEFLADINIFICRKCLTAQTQHDVDIGDYYEDYQYSVGKSATASHFMRLLAENLKNNFYPKINNKKVLEIGSGDGEQLVAFNNTGCHVLGYEPSSSLCRVAESKGIPTVQGLFTQDSINRLPEEFQEVDVVMLSYTFDHLPEPKEFLAAARSILNKTDGLLVVEIHNLEKIIERQEYCLFEHEHSIYLTESTAHMMCQEAGFVILDYDLVPEADRRANSLIFVATPTNSNLAHKTAKPRTPVEFMDLGFYEHVANDIFMGIANLEKFTDQITSQGKSLAGYGAGGRGVMTLAAMNNSSKFCYLVDKKPKRQGLIVPKSGIPLVGLESLKSNPVDEILVFSFGYMKEIQTEVGALGYTPSQFHSLLDILAGRF